MCFTLLIFYCLFHAINALCFYSISQVKGSMHIGNVNEAAKSRLAEPPFCNYLDNFKLSCNYWVLSPFLLLHEARALPQKAAKPVQDRISLSLQFLWQAQGKWLWGFYPFHNTEPRPECISFLGKLWKEAELKNPAVQPAPIQFFFPASPKGFTSTLLSVPEGKEILLKVLWNSKRLGGRTERADNDLFFAQSYHALVFPGYFYSSYKPCLAEAVT